jgi:hypothetical protein
MKTLNIIMICLALGLLAVTIETFLDRETKDDITDVMKEITNTPTIMDTTTARVGDREVVGSEGISVRSDGKELGLADYITKMMEQAYFEGQRDMLEGDVRIEKTDSNYVWVKSPWDTHKLGNELYIP